MVKICGAILVAAKKRGHGFFGNKRRFELTISDSNCKFIIHIT